MGAVWTAAEDKALIDARAAGMSFDIIGANVLPHRSMHGIRSRAQDLTAVPKDRSRRTDARRASIDRELTTTTDSNREIADRWGVSLNYVQKRVSRLKLASRGYNPPNKLPLPDDFAARASSMTLAQIANTFGVSEATAVRWRRLAGIAAISAAEAGRVGAARRWGARAAPTSKLRIHKPMHGWAAQTTVEAARRDMTLAGRAADECLRRIAPTFRCTAAGVADPNGSHWRYGSTILTSDELVERAERKGWNPNGWRRVA